MALFRKISNALPWSKRTNYVWPVNLSVSNDDRGRLVVFGEQNPDWGITHETAAFLSLSLRESGGKALLIEVSAQNASEGRYFNCWCPNISQHRSSEDGLARNLLDEVVIQKERLNLDLVLGFPGDYQNDGPEVAAAYKLVVQEALDKYDAVIVDATKAGPELGDLKRWLGLNADVNLTSRHVPSPKAEVALSTKDGGLWYQLREALEIEAWPAGEGPWLVGQGKRAALLVPTPEWFTTNVTGRGEMFTVRGIDSFLRDMEPLGKLIVEPSSLTQT